MDLFYAFALEKMGRVEVAEREFRSMDGRFINYEARYHYGCFLLRLNRPNDALNVFAEVADEATHMTWKEKKGGREWINKCKEEWAKLMAQKE